MSNREWKNNQHFMHCTLLRTPNYVILFRDILSEMVMTKEHLFIQKTIVFQYYDHMQTNMS
jgi:hypothetical protein